MLCILLQLIVYCSILVSGKDKGITASGTCKTAVSYVYGHYGESEFNNKKECAEIFRRSHLGFSKFEAAIYRNLKSSKLDSAECISTVESLFGKHIDFSNLDKAKVTLTASIDRIGYRKLEISKAKCDDWKKWSHENVWSRVLHSTKFKNSVAKIVKHAVVTKYGDPQGYKFDPQNVDIHLTSRGLAVMELRRRHQHIPSHFLISILSKANTSYSDAQLIFAFLLVNANKEILESLRQPKDDKQTPAGLYELVRDTLDTFTNRDDPLSLSLAMIDELELDFFGSTEEKKQGDSLDTALKPKHKELQPYTSATLRGILSQLSWLGRGAQDVKDLIAVCTGQKNIFRAVLDGIQQDKCKFEVTKFIHSVDPWWRPGRLFTDRGGINSQYDDVLRGVETAILIKYPRIESRPMYYYFWRTYAWFQRVTKW